MVTINSDAVRNAPVVADSESAPGPAPGYYINAARDYLAILLDDQNVDATIPVHSYGFGMSGDKVLRLNPDLRVIEIVPATLVDAQRELAGVAEEAREEGYPVPSDPAFENARRLLPEICLLTPRPVAVYPDPDDGIAIDISGGFGRSVLLLCESGGSALCSVNLDGEHRRARYDNTRTLPDGFIREALAEMESKPRE